jgi:hypothetical protein
MTGNKLGADNMSAIFVIIATLTIISIAIVALANKQSTFGYVNDYTPCKYVKITNPPDGTLSITLSHSTLFQGYAKSGHTYKGVCYGTDVQGSNLKWYVQYGGFVGTGKSITEAAFEQVLPQGAWNCNGNDVTLEATFPNGSHNTAHIHIRGTHC